jgi:hypothetical protein
MSLLLLLASLARQIGDRQIGDGIAEEFEDSDSPPLLLVRASLLEQWPGNGLGG